MNETDYSYDRVAYQGIADGAINLRNLEVAATLAGFDPADITACRVLEIGCGDGTNLLPSACDVPDSRFVGIDLSEVAIRQARQLAGQLGLSNVEFRHQSFGDIESHGESFDYILCSGVFSWVSDEDRLAILRLCRDCLSTGGIAAISYNTLPGWSRNASLREYLRQHVSSTDPPQQQIGTARQVLDQLVESSHPHTRDGAFVRMMRDYLNQKNDAYLYHEYLAEHNCPLHFEKFQELAEQHQLKFVAEADFRQASRLALEPAIQEAVRSLPPERREQRIDVLVNRNSRRSIVCRADLQPACPPHHQLPEQMHVAFVDPLSGVQLDPSDPQPMTLNFEHGSATIDGEALKIAVGILTERWPEASRLSDLDSEASRLASQTPTIPLAKSLMSIYATGMLKVFKSTPPPVTARVSSKPMASALTRAAATDGRTVVNAWHQNVNGLSDDERAVISRLDGERDLDALAVEPKMLESIASRLLLVS